LKSSRFIRKQNYNGSIRILLEVFILKKGKAIPVTGREGG
jgi:hypothetical protein